MGHTALPWKVRYHPNGRDCFIEGPKPEGMAYALEILGDDYNGFGDEEVRKADAGFIVRACNAHDELVRALQQYEAAFDNIFAQCLSNPITNAFGEQVNVSLLNEAHQAARAALAKAGAE